MILLNQTFVHCLIFPTADLLKFELSLNPNVTNLPLRIVKNLRLGFKLLPYQLSNSI